MLQHSIKTFHWRRNRNYIKEGTTQVDPVSIAIYGVGVTPLIIMLIRILSNEYSANVNVIAYADDFPAVGNLQDLRRWWSVSTENEIWLLSRANKDLVSSVFFRTKIMITMKVADILKDQSVHESLKTYTSQQKLVNGLVNQSCCQR